MGNRSWTRWLLSLNRHTLRPGQGPLVPLAQPRLESLELRRLLSASPISNLGLITPADLDAATEAQISIQDTSSEVEMVVFSTKDIAVEDTVIEDTSLLTQNVKVEEVGEVYVGDFTETEQAPVLYCCFFPPVNEDSHAAETATATVDCPVKGEYEVQPIDLIPLSSESGLGEMETFQEELVTGTPEEHPEVIYYSMGLENKETPGSGSEEISGSDLGFVGVPENVDLLSVEITGEINPISASFTPTSFSPPSTAELSPVATTSESATPVAADNRYLVFALDTTQKSLTPQSSTDHQLDQPTETSLDNSYDALRSRHENKEITSISDTKPTTPSESVDHNDAFASNFDRPF